MEQATEAAQHARGRASGLGYALREGALGLEFTIHRPPFALNGLRHVDRMTATFDDPVNQWRAMLDQQVQRDLDLVGGGLQSGENEKTVALVHQGHGGARLREPAPACCGEVLHRDGFDSDWGGGGCDWRSGLPGFLRTRRGWLCVVG